MFKQLMTTATMIDDLGVRTKNHGQKPRTGTPGDTTSIN